MKSEKLRRETESIVICYLEPGNKSKSPARVNLSLSFDTKDSFKNPYNLLYKTVTYCRVFQAIMSCISSASIDVLDAVNQMLVTVIQRMI